MRMRTLELLHHNPKWADLFKAEEDLLRFVLGDVVVGIHHVGSTSVIGLMAKPIIDILLEVKAHEVLDSRGDGLIANGYTPKGEFGIPGRRFFVKGGENPTHHVHAFVEGDANIDRHLAFRDYLRGNPDVAKQYQEAKQHALAACGNDIGKYCELKNDFIQSAEAAALRLGSASRRNNGGGIRNG
ncbi:MAG: GrpB family protein [Fibrobacteres bacterium]|nr:GrpB family protein [Fibrobacterota bacterium]